MQCTSLPAAADLYDRQSTSVGEADEEWSSPPWGSFLLLGLAITVLLLVQQWLWKLTGRRINPGLALSTVLVIATFLITMIAGFLAANDNAKGLSEGAAPMNELTRQRINAQKVRAQETLNLVRRTDPEGSSAERAAILGGVRDTLTVYLDPEESGSGRVSLDDDGAVTDAIDALDDWMPPRTGPTPSTSRATTRAPSPSRPDRTRATPVPPSTSSTNRCRARSKRPGRPCARGSTTRDGRRRTDRTSSWPCPRSPRSPWSSASHPGSGSTCEGRGRGS